MEAALECNWVEKAKQKGVLGWKGKVLAGSAGLRVQKLEKRAGDDGVKLTRRPWHEAPWSGASDRGASHVIS